MYLSVRYDWALEDLTLAPNFSDLEHISQNAKFLLFLSANRPRFGRFNFIQKFDYFAALFGLVLMLATGLVAGFPEHAVAVLPPLYFGDLRAIHSALGFMLIFVFLGWHLYHNLLAPGKFLANWSWIIGTMPAHIVARDHAAFYDEVVERERAERLKKEKAAEERSMHRVISKQSRRLEEYLEAGNRHAKQEEYEEAIEQYQRALDLLPNFPQARYNIATVYHKAGNLAQAAAEYRKFLEVDPFNTMAEKVRSILREIEKSVEEGSTDDR
jgi:tetratricopeptide (TPR) repeat protein